MNDSAVPDLGRVVILNRDLFFGVKISNAARTIGLEPIFVRSVAAFFLASAAEFTVLGVIDIGVVDDWSAVAEEVERLERPLPIIAFGPHKDVEGLRAAKRAGVTRVISNGDFHARTAEILKRYAAADVARNDEAE
jgi:hypothetical protein